MRQVVTRALLFDLGDTLVDERPTAAAGGGGPACGLVQDLRDAEGRPVPSGARVGLGDELAHPARQEVLRQRYLAELGESGLDRLLPAAGRAGDPVHRRRGLEARPADLPGRPGPSGPGMPFRHAVFVTERAAHVEAARALGMMAVHFRGPGQATGDVEQLADLLALLRRMLAFSPCHKTHAERGRPVRERRGPGASRLDSR